MQMPREQISALSPPLFSLELTEQSFEHFPTLLQHNPVVESMSHRESFVFFKKHKVTSTTQDHTPSSLKQWIKQFSLLRFLYGLDPKEEVFHIKHLKLKMYSSYTYAICNSFVQPDFTVYTHIYIQHLATEVAKKQQQKIHCKQKPPDFQVYFTQYRFCSFSSQYSFSTWYTVKLSSPCISGFIFPSRDF